MYSENTLRNKAKKAGYTIKKGFSHYHYNNSIVVYGGERVTGYLVIDDSSGCTVWDSSDTVRSHTWQLEDVENFLKEKYEEAGLKF